MTINILAFGIAKEIMGGASISQILDAEATVAGLKDTLEIAYPKLRQLTSYAVAVNNEYASDDVVINQQDEIAIIPPVSGG